LIEPNVKHYETSKFISYEAYINYPKKINAKEAVAGVLWASWIMEKPLY